MEHRAPSALAGIGMENLKSLSLGRPGATHLLLLCPPYFTCVESGFCLTGDFWLPPVRATRGLQIT